MVKKEKLFDQFPPVTTKEWLSKINIDLKGADFHKKLVWKTNEGFDVKPFYRMEDVENLMYVNLIPGQFPFLRGTKINNNNWRIRQNIEVTNYSEANRKALAILTKGVDSIGFSVTDPQSVNEKNFDLLLEGICFGGAEINFISEGKAKEILVLVKNFAEKSSCDPESVRGAYEADPLGRLMVNGTLCIPPDDGFDYLASALISSGSMRHFKVININVSNFSNAGAGIVQELAFGISMGNEYLSQLTARGIGSDLAASKIRFSFGIGSDYFPEIAKLRAARLLWSAVNNGFHPEKAGDIKMDIHCVTTRWNKTIYDPFVNMLRTQTEAMSAILGGTDSLTVEPFDKVFRQPDEFSERIARNQQLILKEEAYFDKVADPAAGAYYIENLTNILSENAWKLFLEIEDRGGFLACLKSGFIQKTISESSEKIYSDISARRKILVGTNQYPNTSERISESDDINKSLMEMQAGNELLVDPVKLSRACKQFDRLRIAVDRAAKRPVVFLLQIGNLAMRKARAQFSANFFGCAGYQIVESPGFSTVDSAVNEALASDPDIIVICSSDEEYLVFAPEIYNKTKDKAIIVVAGNPQSVEELKTMGIDNFIHIRSNTIDLLSKFNERLGIECIF